MSSNFPQIGGGNRGEQTIGHRENERVRSTPCKHLHALCREEPIRVVWGLTDNGTNLAQR